MIKKTNTLIGDFEYISVYDDAVDSSGDDFPEKWKRYLDGQAEPPLKPGEQPTVFVLKHLTELEKKRLIEQEEKHGHQATALTACAIGIKAAKNWTDGKTHTFAREVDTAWIYPISIVKAEELALLPQEVLTDLGGRIVMAATPRPN